MYFVPLSDSLDLFSHGMIYYIPKMIDNKTTPISVAELVTEKKDESILSCNRYFFITNLKDIYNTHIYMNSIVVFMTLLLNISGY